MNSGSQLYCTLGDNESETGRSMRKAGMVRSIGYESFA